MASFRILITLSLVVGIVRCATLPSAPGDVAVEGYFDVHTSDGTVQEKCGKIDTQNAIAFLEAFRYAMNSVNQLKNNAYKYGYSVKDTCNSAVVLKRTIKKTCMDQYAYKFVGIVGPSTSDAAIEISQVVNIWSLPSFSYGASSSALEQKSKHEYVLRTIPSDSYQRRALLDVIRHFNWTYFATVSSCSVYDQQGLALFTRAIRRDKRCLARVSTLPCVRSSASYEDTLRAIVKDVKVNVVVLLTSKDDTIGLLMAAKKIGLRSGRLTWVAGTGWGNLALKQHGLEDVALGAVTLAYGSQGSMEDFKRYFFTLNPQNNNYTTFIEFWEEVFNCSTGSLIKSDKKVACTGKERLAEGKGWHPFTNVEPVFDAVYALYRGLTAKIPFCYLPPQLCSPHALVVATTLPKWLLQNSFLGIYNKRNVTFNTNGGVEGHFNILNFAASKSGNAYKLVGTWRSNGIKPADGKLHLSAHLIQWSGTGQLKAPESICSLPCRAEKGEISIPDKNENIQLCCWTCKKCGVDEKIVNNSCVYCGSKQKSNAQRDACEVLPEKTVQYSDPVGIVVLCFSVLGIVATTAVALLFAKFYSSRIVKASGRESSFFMLVGINLCFIAPLIFLAKPTIVACGAQRFIAGLSFSTVYAPLFLKTNRIFRIFQSAKSTTARPSLVSPISQVLISLGIVSIQLLLGIVWVIGDPPRVELKYSNERDYADVYCGLDPYTMALNLCTCLVMMLACTWYAFKTRHFPKNYNETKSIMFTLYFSCFAWGVFVPTFLLSSNQDSFFRTYTLAVFCEVIAYVSLVGFFFPKIRLLICSSQIDDKEDMVLSRVGEASKHHLDTRRIVVGGSFSENPRTMHDNISVCTSETNLSDKSLAPKTST